MKLKAALDGKQFYKDKYNESAAEVSDLKVTRDELQAELRQLRKTSTA